jgi:hypothetical protein
MKKFLRPTAGHYFTCLAFCLCLTPALHAQQYDTITTDDYTIIQEHSKTGVPEGSYRKFSSDEALMEYGSYKNGLKVGQWKYFTRFYSDEAEAFEKQFGKEMDFNAIRLTMNYKNGIAHGECYYELGDNWREDEDFKKSKHSVCYGQYTNGKRDGEWTLHNIFDSGYSYGRKIGSFHFLNGVKHGKWEITYGPQNQGVYLPYPTLLDSVEIREINADRSYASGFYQNGKKTGTWKYFTQGGELFKTEAFDSVGSATVLQEHEVTNIVISDVSFDRVDYIDINPDSTRILLVAYSPSTKLLTYWLYDNILKGLIKKETLNFLGTSVNGCYFFNDAGTKFACLNWQDDLVTVYDIQTGQISSIKSNDLPDQLLNRPNTLKALKAVGIHSFTDLGIREERWLSFEDVEQTNQFVALNITTPEKHFYFIDLATGKVSLHAELVSQKSRVDYVAERIKAGMSPTLRSDIDQYAIRNINHDNLLTKIAFNRSIRFGRDIFEDVSEFRDRTNNILMLGYVRELKRFHYGYEHQASYTDRRTDSRPLYFWNKKVVDPKKRIVQLNVLENGSYIFFTKDNYYMTTPGMKEKINFRKDVKLFPFEQFDLKYNRPDLVLERLGYADSSTLATYHKAYLKRLKKLGFTEDMLNDDFHLPEIKIENFEYFPAVVDSARLDIDLSIRDVKYKLDRINVFINDVPILGNAGIDLRKENIQEAKRKIKLTLAEGINKIQMCVLNQAGAESYKETVTVTYKPKKVSKANLYLITIGDSQYKDARYNLTYAAKDAEDTKVTFQQNSLYQNVFTYTYVDEQVTKANILALKKELAKATRDDVVIITVAGHGVLDQHLDYYLATYDMDFANPSQKGIPYEELEALVDGIAPLKKVLFLDACHSGEVDKEEVEQFAAVNPTSGSIKFRNAGAGIKQKNLGLHSTAQLMSELFNDLRRGTGATVISSAGGAEYAMESDQWKNGLFTYCLLHGLKNKAADLNHDGQIMLSELQQYLRTEVTKLSQGAQQPTSRIENLSMDFRVW